MLSKEDRRFDSSKELAEYYSGLTGSRYECEMIQANLLLAHNESILMFILPSTFILGDTFRKARCQISTNFHVHSIVKLPHDTFCRGRINTFAVIMTKHKNEACEQLKLYDAENKNGWTLKHTRNLNYEDTLGGFWWVHPEKHIAARDCNIHRGTISSSCFASSGCNVIHCAAKQTADWQPSIRYFNPQKAPRQILYAELGDILIDRIGKGAGYWCINTHHHTPVSDCIFVISKAPDLVISALKNHSDNSGRLNIPTRGVATPYITTQDVLDLLGAVPKQA